MSIGKKTPKMSNDIPVRFDCSGNDAEVVLKPEQVVEVWKNKHLYEVAFTDENDLAVLFGDVDVSVKKETSLEDFNNLNEQYKLALTNFIGSHQFALASASSYEAKKISWRFYIPDLVGTASTQKEFAEKINKEKQITLEDGTPVRLDLAVYHTGRKMRMLHAWKQTKTNDGGLETDKKKWENRPLKLIQGTEEDTILHRVKEGAELLASRRKEKVVPLKYDDFDLIRKLVLECWTEERANEYISWLKGIWAIRSVEKSDRGLELAHDFSKRSYKYNERAVEEAWKQGKDKITIGSIHFWAKADNPIRYAELTARLPIEFLEKNINEGDEGLANIFTKAYEETIVSQSGIRKTFYAYNNKTGLWEEVCPEYITTLFTGTMKIILTPLAIKLANQYKDITDNEEGKALRKKMDVTLNLIKSMTMTKTATKCFPQVFTKFLKDKEWLEKLNSRKDILPVKNGVLELRTGNLRPYELEDYLTYKLDVNYEPEADTSKQEKFFADVLRNDQDAINFTQYFLGYCLTGETNRQQFLILEGSVDGANGKSHLTLCLQNILGKLFSTASRKAFSLKDNDNNDSLYDARFSRMLVVPELNKNTVIDEGLIKTFTGTDAVNVSAKYKNAITFTPQFKVIMPLNEMFPVPADSKAVWRRILLIQFKVRFLGKDNPEWDDELASQGLMKEKDEEFANNLKDDKEGWLNWLVEGSKMYYSRPNMEAPMCLQQHLLTKQEDNDPHLKFIRKEFMTTGNQQDFITVAELSIAYCRSITEEETVTSRRIATAMKKLGIKKGVRDVNNKSTKCWIGLRWKTEEEKAQEEE